jgi:hypothetical protein
MGGEGSLLRGIRGRWRACRELVGLADPPEGSDGWHSGVYLSMPNIVFCPALRHSHCLPCCLGGAGRTEWQSGSLSGFWKRVRQSTVRLVQPMTWPTAVDGSRPARVSSWMSLPISGNKLRGGLNGVSLRQRRRTLPVLTLRAPPRSSAHLSPRPWCPCPCPCPCAPGSRCGCRQRAAGHRDRGQMAWSRSTSLRTCMLGRVLTGDAAGGGQ